MKKFIILLSIIISGAACCAYENLSFIYINGSNNNDEKMKNWYINGVKKLHPAMRKKLMNRKSVKAFFESSGGINIKEEPVIFFWGYNSRENLAYVKNQLHLSKNKSSKGSFIVRSLISKYLHDAIWVQKEHNMLPILDDLNDYVKKEAAEGRDVILFGYSAGTFVSYEYMFNKLRYINLADLFKSLNADEDIISFAEKHPVKNSCISAIQAETGGIGTFTKSGQVFLNPDKELLKERYLKLDEITECRCAPDKNFRGIVNFASPLTLFYSDMDDDDYFLNRFNKLMIKHIIENQIYVLTINFKEDPLGFPLSRNMTAEEIGNKIGLKIENPSGFIYDNSGVWSSRLFPFAHTAYWNARRIFPAAVSKSFEEGYRLMYNEEYRKKIYKKNKTSKNTVDL